MDQHGTRRINNAQLYLIDLKTGAAAPLGKVGSGESLRGIAIEP
jgi:hypothetical protein